MNITKKIEDSTTTLELCGRLDTMTSTYFSSTLEAIFAEEKRNLVLNMSELDYVSSAGLRVLLAAQKRVNALGTKMKITGVNDTVREIFEITGFSGILDIE